MNAKYTFTSEEIDAMRRNPQASDVPALCDFVDYVCKGWLESSAGWVEAEKHLMAFQTAIK